MTEQPPNRMVFAVGLLSSYAVLSHSGENLSPVVGMLGGDIIECIETAPTKPGIYVWEGNVESYDDTIDLVGPYRPATTEDLLEILRESESFYNKSEVEVWR